MAEPRAEPIGKPGWVAAVDAEQDGINVAAAVHAFWQTLRNREPKMSKEDIERRTDRYQDGVMGYTSGLDDEEEAEA